jgi:heptosyltransferase-2
VAHGNKHILVVAPNWLGDAVMSLPLVGSLSAVRGVRVHVLAPDYTARVFWGLPGVDDLVVLGRRGALRGLLRRRAVLAGIELDAAIILPVSFSSALTVLLSGVAKRIGYRSDARGALLTDSLSTVGVRDEHCSENYLRLGRLAMEQLGVEGAGEFTAPQIRVFDSERSAVVRLLGSRGIQGPDYAVVVPGAVYGSTKAWPREKYRQLVSKLAADMPVILAGSAGERALCETIAEGVHGAWNAAGETTLGELFALLEESRVVVANDSGAPHVAASLGVPTVVIFGSTSPRWTVPLGVDVHVVQEPVHCAPCFLRKCPTQLECYAGIMPERVHEAALAAMRKPGKTIGAGS